MSIHYSKELTDFVVDTRYEDLTTNVVHQAKRVILDFFGNTLAGYGQKSGEIVAEYAKEISGKGDATILGYGNKVNYAAAALVNGTLAEIMEIQDLHPLTAHPAAAVLPSSIAVAETNNANGRELITATVLGIDVACRIADAVGHPFRKWGFRPVTIFGTIGAGLAAAKLLELDKGRMLNALGIVGTIEPVGLMQHFGKGNFTMDKDLINGWSAYSGVTAATLAHKGFTGAQDFLEGERYGFCQAYTSWGEEPDLPKLTKDLGKKFHILDVGFKWYPGAGNTHTAIEATLEILKKEEIIAEDIDKITIKTTALSSSHNRGVNNFRASFFDIPYLVAVTIIDKTHSLDDILKQHTEDRIRDSEVLELRDKIEMVEDSELTKLASRSKTYSPAIIIIRMKGGREYIHSVYDPKGRLKRTLTDEEIKIKFKSLAQIAGLNANQISEVINYTEKLEKINNISKIIDLLS
jgi:2-methylcitrate dehydratase PrpD